MNQLVQATALVLVAGLVVGCAATRGRSGAVEESGFLRDYSKLEPNPNFPAHEVYINPKAVWVKYDSIQLDSVTLWANEDSGRLSDEEKQMLTDTLYSALHDQLGREFFLVDQAGPSTIRIRAALTEEKDHLGLFYKEERPVYERSAREFEPEQQQFDLETYLKRFA